MLGHIVFETAVPVLPPIVSYFSYADFPRTIRNPPAARCLSLDLAHLCLISHGVYVFSSLIFLRGPCPSSASSIARTTPGPEKTVRCIDFPAITASADDYLRDHRALRRTFMGSESQAHTERLKHAPSLGDQKRSAKRTTSASISFLRLAISGIPTFAADRTSPGCSRTPAGKHG